MLVHLDAVGVDVSGGDGDAEFHVTRVPVLTELGDCADSQYPQRPRVTLTVDVGYKLVVREST